MIEELVEEIKKLKKNATSNSAKEAYQKILDRISQKWGREI